MMDNVISLPQSIIHSPLRSKSEASLIEVCQEFESLFIYFLLKAMDATIMRANLFNENSNANKIIREMYYEELARELSKAGGIGLADFLYDQLSRSSKPSTREVSNQKLEIRTQLEEYNKFKLQYQLPLP